MIFPCRNSAQAVGAVSLQEQNLRNCLYGIETCDRSQLTVAQASQISNLMHDRNLMKCLMGYEECDHSLLAPSEELEATNMAHDRNLLACETTLGICDKTLLRPTEAAKVARVEKEQNQLDCETGMGSCDYSLLTASEVVLVRALNHEHDFLACKTGANVCDDRLLALVTASVVIFKTLTPTNPRLCDRDSAQMLSALAKPLKVGLDWAIAKECAQGVNPVTQSLENVVKLGLADDFAVGLQ